MVNTLEISVTSHQVADVHPGATISLHARADRSDRRDSDWVNHDDVKRSVTTNCTWLETFAYPYEVGARVTPAV